MADSKGFPLRERKQAAEIGNMLVVLSQPHRRGNTSQLCGDPLGRFVLKYKLDHDVYTQGCRYGLLVSRYYAAHGIPLYYRDKGGSGRGISAQATKMISKAFAEVHKALKERISKEAISALNSLAVFENEIAPVVEVEAKEALLALEKLQCL